MNNKYKKETNSYYSVSKNEKIEEIAHKTGNFSFKILIKNNITPLMLNENVILFVM